jgi:hypothetical protein
LSVFKRVLWLLGASLAAFAALGSAALAAGPPALKVANGGKAQLVASGIATPTSFAFGDGKVFYSDGTPPSAAPGIGGVYVISNGMPTRLPGSPVFSFGVTWRKGTLYVSGVNQLLAWSGWNGTTFTHQRTLYTAPKGFPGFNGLAFGANGRLYAGVDVGATNDHGPATAPYQYDILSFTAQGKGLKVVATGVRQPWQFAFPKGSSSPFVSDLGQDKPGAVANKSPDFLLRVRKGDAYGFPNCTWISKKACKGFAKPYRFFIPHTDVMGLGILGTHLYMSEFGVSTAPRVVSMPLHGGAVKPVATGFTSNVVGLGVNNGWVYVAQTASMTPTGAIQFGFIFRIKP